MGGYETYKIISIVIQNEIDGRNQQIKDKNAEIDAIDQARTGLETLGDEQFTVFQQNVKVIQTYWNAVQADAVEIKGWLQDGANLAVREPLSFQKKRHEGMYNRRD